MGSRKSETGPRASGVLLLLAGALVLHPGCRGREDSVYSGTIEAVEVDIVPEVAGRIVARPVDQGDSVDVGTVIAAIDPEPFRIALTETEAALGETKARLALFRAGYREEEVRAAAREVDEAEAQVVLAGAQVRRVESLVAQQVSAAADLDIARRDLDVAKARVAAARARHALLSRGFRPEEIEQARAEAARLDAVLASRRLDLDRTTVRSPLKGTVTEKLREVGEYVERGSPIVSVADLTNLYTWVYLSEVDLPKVREGDRVSVRIDGAPGREYPGKVVYIAREAEFTPRNVQTVEDRVQLVFGVKVAVTNNDGSLKIGIPADVALAPRAAP